jgi:hypothetical protein
MTGERENPTRLEFVAGVEFVEVGDFVAEQRKWPNFRKVDCPKANRPEGRQLRFEARVRHSREAKSSPRKLGAQKTSIAVQ